MGESSDDGHSDGSTSGEASSRQHSYRVALRIALVSGVLALMLGWFMLRDWVSNGVHQAQEYVKYMQSEEE